MERPEKLTSANGLTEYARQLALAGNREPFTGTDYCRSEKIDAVVAASPFILQIRVEELLIGGQRQDRETYWCTVEKPLRGQPQAGIWVVFPYGMATVGGQYLALLDRSSDQSLIYTMTSRVSIIPLEDQGRVNEVLQYLK